MNVDINFPEPIRCCDLCSVQLSSEALLKTIVYMIKHFPESKGAQVGTNDQIMIPFSPATKCTDTQIVALPRGGPSQLEEKDCSWFGPRDVGPAVLAPRCRVRVPSVLVLVLNPLVPGDTRRQVDNAGSLVPQTEPEIQERVWDFVVLLALVQILITSCVNSCVRKLQYTTVFVLWWLGQCICIPQHLDGTAYLFPFCLLVSTYKSIQHVQLAQRKQMPATYTMDHYGSNPFYYKTVCCNWIGVPGNWFGVSDSIPCPLQKGSGP